MQTVVVTRKGSQRLRQGHVWVFAADVANAAEAGHGDIVRVCDEHTSFIGYAFYSSSKLALRLLTRETRPPDSDFFRARLKGAIARRARGFAGRDAVRLVHGESDGLPGLLVDRFGDGVVLQTLAKGTDVRRDLLVELLVALCGPRVVVVRDDGATRDYEGLGRYKAVVFGQDPKVVYHEGDIQLTADLLLDQKTGSFLDQVDNHLRVRHYARGQCLDLFCYHGAFGLQMAACGERVLCVDQSAAAVERVRYHAQENGICNLEALEKNAFDLLRELESRGERFDTIVIDPPAFAKRKSALPSAYRGYKELNLRAMRLLLAGGVLVTCSCSAKMTPDVFEAMLIEAAHDTHRRMLILERRGAGADHPALLGMPETEYLKCYVLQAAE